MKDVNKVILLGRLGGDPIQRQTKAGTTVVHFSIATARKIVREDQQTEEETQWHNIVSWGKLADVCSKYLKKGDPVYLEGSIRSRQYEDKNGQDRMRSEIHLDEISFLGQKRTEVIASP